jgi:hypothetical protein
MAKRWAQNPPSMGKMKFVVAIVLLYIALYAIERIWGWTRLADARSGPAQVLRLAQLGQSCVTQPCEIIARVIR